MPRRPAIDERQSFAFELGQLVRTVTTRGGRTYCHRCSLASYQAVAHCIAESAGQGVTTNMLWEAAPEIPCTQASVAVAFMKERGCLAVRMRRMFPASNFFYEDALIEWHALAHGSS
jgi:hypothetical protein